MIFAAVIQYGPDKAKIAEVRPSHRQYLLGLRDAGKMAINGPFGDDSGALIVYSAETKEEVDAMLREDPFAKAGVFASWTIRQWNPAFINRSLLPE
jgi:uncharacterized protein YciI